MKNKATLLLHSFDELIGCLTDEEAGRLLKAILDYDIRGNTTDFDDRAMRFLFVQIRNSLDTHKAHYEKVCDEVWFIYADAEIRKQRLRDGRSYTNEKTESIMKRQLSDALFREQCDVVIDNSGDFSDTCMQIEQAMKH